MKFAKELQDQLVPEWQAKYFDYKIGKKKVKAIARALRALEATSSSSSRLPTLSNNVRQSDHHGSSRSASSPGQTSQQQSQQRQQSSSGQGPFGGSLGSLPIGIPERTPLCSPATGPQRGSYGSIIASPPDERDEYLDEFELPDPAISPDLSETARGSNSPTQSTNRQAKQGSKESPDGGSRLQKTRSGNGNGHNDNRNRGDGTRSFLSSWTPSFRGTPGAGNGRRRSAGRLQRVLSAGERGQRKDNESFGSSAYKEFETKELDFVSFLDGELDKIEEFYKQKEDEFTERLRCLRDQLHLLRDMRIAELRRKRTPTAPRSGTTEEDGFTTDMSGDKKKESGWKKRLPSHQRNEPSFTATTPVHPLPMNIRPSNEGDRRRIEQRQQRRDFARKLERDIPYRTAKRRLKVALIEFYRGLELLKSYADLNHKAFRKINKKYDKVTHARPTLRYLTENVNRAWFVQSEVLDTYLNTVEDLYSRYFEKGNRKVAVGKLRGKVHRTQDYSASTFRNGFMFSAGFVLGVQGLASAGEHLFHPDPVVRTQTSYLLQLYGGYCLILLHFLFFCLDCFIWTRSKINYIFVFEYDTRNVLDWRQLSELPCLFTLLFGLTMFLNFRWVNISVYIYWPVILIGLTVIILFLPVPVMYWRARRWWAYSNWRLLLAGLYPVEFRDFFLGDMYCSQTYAMGNIALFFCLYGHKFHNAPQCNSSHSRAMGFMSTLPAIFRGLQCLRRYIDTRNSFPHLVNMGKYTSTLVFYMTLSIYRIDRRYDLRAIFITFAVINALYSSTWDLAMDWSLGNIYSKNWGLRDSLAIRKKWVYYAAMILDPFLRFNWIFYVIFPREFQHSALLSFIVALSEVIRRGIWVIFRVENEHCTNVELFRASRDVPLPYEIPPSVPVTPRQAESFSEGRVQRATARPIEGSEDEQQRGKTQSPYSFFHEQPGASASRDPFGKQQTTDSPGFNAASDVERNASRSLRREPRFDHRSSISRMGTMLARAHTQDFERRVPAGDAPGGADGSMSSSDDEEEEQEGIMSGSDGKKDNDDGNSGKGENRRTGGHNDTSSS